MAILQSIESVKIYLANNKAARSYLETLRIHIELIVCHFKIKRVPLSNYYACRAKNSDQV